MFFITILKKLTVCAHPPRSSATEYLLDSVPHIPLELVPLHAHGTGMSPELVQELALAWTLLSW